MKVNKVVVCFLALTILISGCASEQPVSMVGISGSDLTKIVRPDQLDPQEYLVFTACQNFRAFETGTLENTDGSKEELSSKQKKTNLRYVTIQHLQSVAELYEEVTLFEEGIKEKLADPDSSPDGYLSFSKFCRTYDNVLKNIQENWSEPGTIVGACFNTTRVEARLEEKIDGIWTELTRNGLEKSEYCQGKYPYAARFSIDKSLVDKDRILHIVYFSTYGRFANGKSSYSSPDVTFPADSKSLIIDSAY